MLHNVNEMRNITRNCRAVKAIILSWRAFCAYSCESCL